MKSIEIPDSLYEKIVEIGKLRKTQNNRATADPLYFCVEEVMWLPVPKGHGDRVVFYLESDTDTHTIDELKKYLADYHDIEVPPEFDSWVKRNDVQEISSYLDNSSIPNRYGEEMRLFVKSNVFFTEKACEEFIVNNLHNLHTPHSYAEHAYRNHEMKSIIELIDTISKGEQDEKVENSNRR